MRKNAGILFAAAVLAVILFSSGAAFADVIAPGTHTIQKCVKIINTDEFSDYVFIGTISLGAPRQPFFQMIDSNACLDKGYKFNSYNIYAFKLQDFDANKLVIGTDENLLFDLSKAIPADTNIELNGETVSDFDPRISENVEYSIASVDEKIVLLKVSDEYGNGNAPQDNNSTPSDLNTSDNNSNVIPYNTPAQSNFFQNIMCFFLGLFGQKC
jgi:hypothetical protein